MSRKLLALDQGTSSSRALVFDAEASCLGVAQREFRQHYPEPGRVEHDPAEIWSTSLGVCRDALAQAGVDAAEVAAIGITNQRETTLLWDRATGEPMAPAIVWQDRRTAGHCARLRADGAEEWIRARTGLLLDPYFSATKLAWLLEHVGGARARAERGELAFGTVDTWLMWRFTGGAVHRTDVTNACRTLLFDIHRGDWDDELLALFGIPRAILPEVCDSSGVFGYTEPSLLGAAVPLAGVAGDQQSAMVGQACLTPGMSKSTYGTGCFMLAHTGETPLMSSNRLLTTVACGLDGRLGYALEGSIFVAGAAIQWLRDRLGLIETAAESEACVRRCGGETDGVYLVPAFTGLGAPWWDAEARGVLCGMTLDTGRDEIVAATLQSVAFQTRDLMDAMAADGAQLSTLRIDGGMVANDWLCQFLADVLTIPVERPAVTETTALGAAWLAGLATGVYRSIEDLGRHWRSERVFEPGLDAERREALLAGWRDAVRRTRGH